jgi:hypothetical protein
MGHDTTAYLGRRIPSRPEAGASSNELGDEIAYLRGNYGQNEALNAEMYNAGVSGVGWGRWFQRAELQAALEQLRREPWEPQYEGEDCSPAVTFLQICLDRLPLDHDWVYIEFG